MLFTTVMLHQVPLSILRSFEAAARTGSFQAAASELSLTPSAISHAVRKLERTLGTALFEREGRTVRLSADGKTLMGYIGRAFDELRLGMERVSTRVPTLLRLYSAPSFAAQWLAPRLPEFLALHPGLQVRLSADAEAPRYQKDEYDAGIAYGAPSSQGDLDVVPLPEEMVTPLCTPDVAKSITSPKDLLNATLIESDNKKIRWSAWFAANCLQAPPPKGLRFDRSFLAIAAASDGMGVALESTLLAKREIEKGWLVPAVPGPVTNVHYTGHYLVIPAGARQRRTARLFSDWLIASLTSERRIV